MKFFQLKPGLGKIAILLTLVGGLTTTIYARETTGEELSPGDILGQVRANYAALISYRDQGRVVASLDGTTTSFDICLARPNFYLVRWAQTTGSSVPDLALRTGKVWSFGSGNHLEMEYGPEDEGSPEIAMDVAASLSASATTTVPMLFLDSQLGVPLGNAAGGETRLEDEKVGKVDCYVIARKSLGGSKTIWVAKQDFLIRQIQTVTSVEEDLVTGGAFYRQSPRALHRVVFTETHFNIMVNQPMHWTDFVP
jgi:hypothetical protein